MGLSLNILMDESILILEGWAVASTADPSSGSGFVLIKIRVKSQDVEELVCINKLAMLLTWLLDLNLLISFVLR